MKKSHNSSDGEENQKTGKNLRKNSIGLLSRFPVGIESFHLPSFPGSRKIYSAKCVAGNIFIVSASVIFYVIHIEFKRIRAI